jgi:hypothetical protein
MDQFTESQNVMVYGMPGCGKTTFAADTPNASHWNLEPGIIAAKRAGSTSGVVHIRSFADAMECLRKAERGDFDHRTWIIVDTVSTLQVKDLNDVVSADVERNPRLDPDVPAIQHYLKAQNSLKRFVERMVDLPINTLFLAHAIRAENDEGDVLWLPSIQGGADKGYPVANYLMALMNVVGFMQVTEVDGEQTRRILWQSYYDADKGIRYTAKDQYSALGRWSDDKPMSWVAGRLAAAQDKPRTKKRG